MGLLPDLPALEAMPARNRRIDLHPNVSNPLRVCPPAIVMIRRANVPDAYFSRFELGYLEYGTPNSDDPIVWTPGSGPLCYLSDGRIWDVRFRWLDVPVNTGVGGGTLPDATLSALVIESVTPELLLSLQSPTCAGHYAASQGVDAGTVVIVGSAQAYPTYRSAVIQRVDDQGNDIRIRTSAAANGGGFELGEADPPFILPVGTLGTCAILAQRPVAAVSNGSIYYSIGTV